MRIAYWRIMLQKIPTVGWIVGYLLVVWVAPDAVVSVTAQAILQFSLNKHQYDLPPEQ
jgi:hypothetical protein